MPYRVLGDDIVIRSDKLSVQYQETLHTLGVAVSKAKTMSSKTTFEFAKRWFHLGIEVSPFPLAAIHELKTNPLGLVETFRTAVEKGWEFKRTGTGPGMVSSLLKLHNIHPAFARKIREAYEISTSFPGPNEDPHEVYTKLAKFIALHGTPVSCVS